MGFVRKLNDVLADIDKLADLRKFNKLMKEMGVPLYVAPISHWYVDTLWQLQGLFGISELWYPWGRFKKHVKSSYSPGRWGGWFWLFEWGSRG